MQNNIDYREIVQTVTANVITDVKNQLASMQPGIVNDIVKRVQSSLQTSLDSITRQLADMQQRLAQVEQKTSSTIPSVQTPKSGGTTNTSSAPPEIDTQTRVMLLRIHDSLKISWGGWIIYQHFDNGHYSEFMIRSNGTDKRDITKCFLSVPIEFIEVIENGSDLIVKYKYRVGKYGQPFGYAVVPKP